MPNGESEYMFVIWGLPEWIDMDDLCNLQQQNCID